MRKALAIFGVVAGSLSIIALSFFITLWILDQGNRNDSAVTGGYPRIAPGQTLRFSGGRNSSALISGWSVPEPNGIWSDGTESKLGLLIVGANKRRNLRLFFEGQAAIFPGTPQQEIGFWANGVKIGEVSLSASAATFSVSLGDLKINTDAWPLVITLKLPKAVMVESRQLGFGLISLRLGT